MNLNQLYGGLLMSGLMITAFTSPAFSQNCDDDTPGPLARMEFDPAASANGAYTVCSDASANRDRVWSEMLYNIGTCTNSGADILDYNTTNNRFEFCIENGANDLLYYWNSTATATACSNAGQLQFNYTAYRMQFCNGTVWHNLP